jgi:hypothetical protein
MRLLTLIVADAMLGPATGTIGEIASSLDRNQHYGEGVMTMKRRSLLAVFVLGSLLTVLLGWSAAAGAQDDLKVEITSFEVSNFDGSDVTGDHLMASDSYVITFTIDAGVDLGNNTLIVSTDLGKVGDVYWQLDNDYPGVNTDTWQPGMSTIEFGIVKGTAEFTLRGKVPDTYTSRKITETGAVLHLPRDMALLKLSLGPAGTLLEERSMNVIDQAINTYQKDLILRETALEQATTGPSPADVTYAALAQDVVDQAKALSLKGYVEEATDLLNTLPESAAGYPTPVQEGSYTLYIIIIAALAALLVAALVLLLRSRAGVSLLRQQVDEEAGKLDVLSVRLSKIDRQLAQDIGQVKEQLERISGR